MAIGYSMVHRDRIVARLSLSSAYVALALLAASLIVGPINVLRRRANPVSYALRRDIGIWAALVGIGHVIVGLQVHLAGRPWLYFLYDRSERHRVPLRHDIFGVANYTGLGATVILALLLALSNDWALRRLGTPHWKRLQRYNYLGAAFVIAHGVAFQVIEQRASGLVILFLSIIAVVLGLQLAGFLQRRRELS
jgi:methionine sulfoxide reductase heme-binding subunit